MLAILFGGGLVLFGVGGNVSGGLVDAFRGRRRRAPTTAPSPTSSSAPQRQAARNPDNPDAWIARGAGAVQPRLLARGLGRGDRRAHRPRPAGRGRGHAGVGALREAEAEEDRRERRGVRGACVRRAPGLRQGGRHPGRPRSRRGPSPNGYFQLADFAYRADQVERGRRARPGRPCARPPSDQRNTVRSLIKDLKKQGKQIAKAVEEAEKAQRAGAQGGQGAASRARTSARCPARAPAAHSPRRSPAPALRRTYNRSRFPGR